MKVKKIDFNDLSAPKKFTQSLEQTGFSVLINHPIEPSLINEVYNIWSKFFSSDSKYKYIFDKDKQDGYFPFKTENAKGKKVKDLKEFYHFFSWGRVPLELESKTKNLYQELIDLTTILLQWIQDETPDNIKSKFATQLPNMIKDSETNLLRIIHYPPLDGSEDKGAIRGAPHEDINLITLLVAGTEPGLQVLDKNNNWHDVSCNPGSIAINIGDMLQEVSGGYYPSTTHQVVNPIGEKIKNESRFSMPLFLHPRADVRLSSRYTAAEYLEERLKEIGLKK